MRTLPILLWAAVAIAAVGAGILVYTRTIAPTYQAQVTDKLGRGDYVLTATDGTPFTQDTLKGQPSAVFFGFTHCPDVCPTTLGDIATWQDVLGDKADAMQFYFITVDPERDDTQTLGQYVGWVPNTLGVTGTRAEIDKAIAAFRIYAAKVPLEGGGYTMDHSAILLLFDDQGRLVEPIAYQEPLDRATDKLARLIAG